MAENLGKDIHRKQVCGNNVEPAGDNVVPEDCTICQDPLDSVKTVVKLQCGHKFHLDCIGSVFNVKDRMECVLCRNIEPGRWLFATGGGSPNPPIDNIHPIVNNAEERQDNVPPLPWVFGRGEPPLRVGSRHSINFWGTQPGSHHFLNNLNALRGEMRAMQRQMEMNRLRNISALMFGGAGRNGEGSSGEGGSGDGGANGSGGAGESG